MTLKKLWIPMLILTVIGGGIKICDTVFNVYGNGFIFSSVVCNWIFGISALILLLTGWIMGIADMKKVFEVQPQKSIFSGIFGFIASVAVISSGIISLLSENPDMIRCILAIAGGGVLLYESCISFTGHNGMTKIPVVSLLVPIWCCSRFMGLFIEYTHRSVAATEIFDIVAAAALLMFLFYQAMFFSGINNASAVRRSTIYAMVFVMLGLTVSADLFIKMSMPSNAVEGIDSEIVMPTLSNILTYAGDIALAIYAVFFSLSNIKAADKTAVIPEPQEEETEKSEEEKEVSAVETKIPAEETGTQDTEKQAEISEEKSDEKEPENVKPVEATPVEEEKKDE